MRPMTLKEQERTRDFEDMMHFVLKGFYSFLERSTRTHER